MISVLIADDEQPAINELAFLLEQDPRIGVIHQASSGAEAIRLLTREPVDAAFLDIHMPGLTGFDLARALARFEHSPVLVFVTADEEGALEAFDLAAVDYVLKPVRTERLHRSVGRIVETLKAGATRHASPEASAAPEVIAVTLSDTTRMIRLDDVRYVQAQGDYARLHTEEASYLVRVPMSDLERQWADVGFMRVHRSYLVSLAHLTRVRLGAERPSITVGQAELPVSRRLLPALRARLDQAAIRPRQ